MSDVGRLSAGNVYSSEEVADVLDSVCTVVKGDVQKDLAHTSHTSAVMLRQLFTQAEDILLDLHVDISQLENECVINCSIHLYNV